MMLLALQGVGIEPPPRKLKAINFFSTSQDNCKRAPQIPFAPALPLHSLQTPQCPRCRGPLSPSHWVEAPAPLRPSTYGSHAPPAPPLSQLRYTQAHKTPHSLLAHAPRATNLPARLLGAPPPHARTQNPHARTDTRASPLPDAGRQAHAQRQARSCPSAEFIARCAPARLIPARALGFPAAPAARSLPHGSADTSLPTGEWNRASQ